MTDKLKKRVRAHMEKTGMSYQASHQAVVKAAFTPPHSAVEPDSARAGRTLDALLAALGVRTSFAVEVGEIPAGGRSANLEVARQQAAETLANPTFFARAGHGEMVVSPAEVATLRAAGAGTNTIQFMRTFRPDHDTTFSSQCRRCSRWVFLGSDEREDSCVCGQHYRATFDLTLEDRSQRRGMCCIDCGTQYKLTQTPENRNPWKPLNAWQMSCALCRRSRPRVVSIENELGGQPFVRYPGDVRLGTAEVFVIENGLRADWARAYESSSGTINGRPHHFWRLPLRPFDDAELSQVRGKLFMFRFVHPGGEKPVLGRLWSWDDRVVRIGASEVTAEPPESSTMPELRGHLVRIDDAP